MNTLYPPYREGGAERSVQLLAEGMAERGIETSVLSLHPERETQRETINGVKVIRLPLYNFYWPYDNQERYRFSHFAWYLLDTYNPLMAGPVRSLVDEISPDLIHLHNLMGFSSALYAQLSDYPLFQTLRDYYFLCLRSSLYRNNQRCDSQCTDCWFFSSLKSVSSGVLDGLIGISDFILNRHRKENVFNNKIRKDVIPNPVETKPANNPTDPGDEQLRIGFIGDISQRKGIEWLLDSYTDLGASDTELIVAGKTDSQYVKELRRRYTEESITFLGFVEPDRFFEDLDLLVVPSLWDEPFGRVVIEGYSYNVPPVVSDRGGLPELVEDGQTGWIVDPERPETLTRQLERLIDDPDLIRSCRENTDKKLQDYSTDEIVDRHLNFYSTSIQKEATKQ